MRLFALTPPVGKAIPDYIGRASYALSISAPLSRISDERIRQLCEPLLVARGEIAAVLGGK